ncbi:MAG: glycosyltransferase family 4 protein [Acidimicrobiales bacterium]
MSDISPPASGRHALRVAIVHPFPWPEVRRGAERYLDDLSQYLSGRGHRVVVITGTHGRGRVEPRPDGVTVRYRRHLPPARFARFGITPVETFGIPAFAALLRERVDVVHAFTPSAALAGRLARLPTLYTVLGHPTEAQLPGNRVPRSLFAGSVRNATVTAVLSHASAAALSSSLGTRAIVLPPGVHLEHFPPDLDPRTGPPRLLFSASLADPRKRADLAVSVLERVLDRHPDARLALSGEGDAGWVLAAASHLGPRVHAAIDVLGTGDPTEVPGRYRSATVTLLPSEHEAFGLVLLESLASGTPVVCSPAGGMPEIVSSAVGKVAASPAPADLAEAVEATIALAALPATPPSCVERARRWSWQATVGPAHERLYEDMAAGGSGAITIGPW